ncbi:hypothetical protein HDU79_008738 [Rhizoclosmatium sp. JEL0117]|nr:hypothetical protein HDU79_008738 [Rhizoclosmatium sp. JEL0117]
MPTPPPIKLSQQEVQERKAVMTKRTGFVFPNKGKKTQRCIEPGAMEWIFGDWLVNKHPRKKVLAVTKSATIAVHFMSTVNPCISVTASRLDWFADLSEDDRTSKKIVQMLVRDTLSCAAFLKEVFGNHTIWRNIVAAADSVEDCFALVAATGKAVESTDQELEEMKRIADDEKFNHWLVYGFLHVWSKNNPHHETPKPTRKEILDLLNQEIYAPLLQRLHLYPAYLQRPHHWTNVLIEYAESSKKTSVGRRIELREALEKQNLTLRNDSKFCEEYIRGLVCVELAEVVAITKLTCTLFAYHHTVWSEFREEKEEEVRELVFGGGMGWMEAVSRVISERAFISEAVKYAASVCKKRGVESRGGEFVESSIKVGSDKNQYGIKKNWFRKRPRRTLAEIGMGSENVVE